MLGSEQNGLNAANGLNAIDGIVRQTAGNKDTIKRLIQTGVISEMQGVLAGMRADEISKAGMLNKGNMPSVAQQVLTPQPPQGMAPPAPPQPQPQMGAPAPQMPMPPQAPQDMQPQGMAGGGSTNDYRLPPMDSSSGSEPHRNLNDIIQTILAGKQAGPVHLHPEYTVGGHPDVQAEINHNLGRANLHAQHSIHGNQSDYGVDTPFLGGDLSANAHASHGYVPDSAHLTYSRSFADGGLAALPVPDDMFNSAVGDSDVQQYAPGGIVAFAGGGSFDDFYNAIVQQESGGRYGVPNAQGSGAMGLGQIMPATAKALAARLNRPYNPALLRGTSPEAREYQDALTHAAAKEAWDYGKGDIRKAAAYYQGGPNKKGWGKDNTKYQSDISRRMGVPSEGPYAKATGSDPTDVPDVASIAQNFELFQGLLGKRDTKARDALLASVNISPEQEKKDKDRDLGYALIAASQAFNKPGPFLSNIAGAIGAMAEPLREGEKSRKAEKLAGLKAAAEAENEDYQDRRSLLAPAAALSAEQMRGREGALARKQQGEQFAQEINQKGLDRQNRLDVEAMHPQSLSDPETYAKTIYDEYVERNKKGTIYIGSKRQPPNSLSDVQLREMAMREALTRIQAAKPQPNMAIDPATGLPFVGTGGPQTAANTNVIQFDSQGNPIQ